jgi:hypothetical protein
MQHNTLSSKRKYEMRGSYDIGGDIAAAATSAGNYLSEKASSAVSAVKDAASSAADSAKDALNWLLGYETVRFKNFLKDKGTEKITKLQVGRVPISAAVNLGMDLLTQGAFNKAKKKLGVDNFFHIFFVVNGKYVIEKNETVNYKPWNKYPKEEDIDVPLRGKDITIDDFIQKAAKGNEKKFWQEYDPLTSNCGQWLNKVLDRNGLNHSTVSRFINQRMEELLKELPGYTNHVGKSITDFASVVNRILQLTTGGRAGFKHGGLVDDGPVVANSDASRRKVSGSFRKTPQRPKLKGTFG